MTTGPSPQDAAVAGYPVQFAVEYPDRPLNRLSTAFRPFAAIPILIVLVSIGGVFADWSGETRSFAVGGTLGGLLFVPPLLMIVFRRKYPRWWFDFNLELQRFTNRVGAYLVLMHDRYPSTDEKQYVALEIPYPDAARDLNRWLPLVKWLLAIPHYVVLLFLWLAALFVAIAAWFAILFTGRFPRGMFDFIEGVLRWTNRVEAYVLLLATDRYPPFHLSP
jgi:small-conductance mechanosensitive channel